MEIKMKQGNHKRKTETETKLSRVGRCPRIKKCCGMGEKERKEIKKVSVSKLWGLSRRKKSSKKKRKHWARPRTQKKGNNLYHLHRSLHPNFEHPNACTQPRGSGFFCPRPRCRKRKGTIQGSKQGNGSRVRVCHRGIKTDNPRV